MPEPGLGDAAVALARAGLRDGLEAIFELVDVGLTISDEQGRFTRVNTAFAHMLGYEPGELVGQGLGEFIVPEQRPVYGERFTIRLTGQATGQREWELNARDGSRRVVRSSATEYFQSGQGRISVGVVIDITSQRQAQQALHESYEQLASVLSSITDGYVLLDQHLRFVDVNPAARRLVFGERPLEELLGKSLEEVCPDGREGPVVRQIELARREGRPAHFEMFSPLSERWFETHIYSRQNRVEIYTRDITERKDYERRLQQGEARLRNALDAGNCGIFEWDMVADRIEWSERLYEFFGVTPDSAPRNLAEYRALLHPEDRERVGAAVRNAIETGAPYKAEYRIVRPSGEVRWLTTHGTALRDGTGTATAMIGACLDITERKVAEAQLLAARDQAEAANRAKDHFLAVLSHELRTPLTPVLMTVVDLEKQARSPAMREELAMIRRNIELESKLIDDLLDVTRIARGKLSLERRAGDAHVLLRNVLEMLSVSIGERRQELRVRMEAEESWVNADGARLQQIFWNLICNASKFTHKGGSIEVRTWNESREDGSKRLLVEVRDNGIGIEPDVLPRIFHAFEQGERHIARRFGGLGLGLAITHALIELHGGRIVAESGGKGLGARFAIELPTCAARVETGERASPEAPAAAAPARLLLVEDNTDTRRVLARLLQRLGYEVRVAGDMASASSAIEAGGLEVVVSDIALPDGTGHELMRRAAQRGMKGIAMSGFGTDSDIQKSMDAGFHAHLIKPIDVANLHAAIQHVMGRNGHGWAGG